MAMTLEDMVLDQKTFEFKISDKSDKVMSITYDPNIISADMISDMGAGTDETCKVLSELIIDWDLEDANKVKVKPTFEFFSGLKLTLVNKFLQAIFDDAFPKAESTPSNVTSRRKARH